jgi:hypothetical protein
VPTFGPRSRISFGQSFAYSNQQLCTRENMKYKSSDKYVLRNNLWYELEYFRINLFRLHEMYDDMCGVPISSEAFLSRKLRPNITELYFLKISSAPRLLAYDSTNQSFLRLERIISIQGACLPENEGLYGCQFFIFKKQIT